MKDKIIILALCCLPAYAVYSQASKNTKTMTEQEKYPKALVDYNDFKNLVIALEKQRAEHLVSLDIFLKMSQEKNTVIFDTRSDYRFNRKHLKGAIHLDFTDFLRRPTGPYDRISSAAGVLAPPL